MHDQPLFTPVTPARPPAAHVVSERRLAAELARRIAAIPHHTYCEAFAGMGVFLCTPGAGGGQRTGSRAGGRDHLSSRRRSAVATVWARLTVLSLRQAVAR